MIKCTRTDSENEHFRGLIKLLDSELADRDGKDHTFYAQFNKIDKIKYAIVCYDNEQPVGCGAIKEYSPDAVEVKRMYVLTKKRNQGIASSILLALEQWASDLDYKKTVLETGKRQPEAIALYSKNDYKIVPNFGQYENVVNSVCFEKALPH